MPETSKKSVHNWDVTFVMGPTGSGKSHYALGLAERTNGVIINGDRMQCYPHLPTLTALPTDNEKKHVTHELYGFLSLHQPWNVALFCAKAHECIKKAHKKGQHPIVVGGSGLYMQRLYQPLHNIPSLNIEKRDAFDRLLNPIETSHLHDTLKIIDPLWAKKVHAHDRRRIIRGLLVFFSTKKALSLWLQEEAPPRPWRGRHIFCDHPPDFLKEKLKKRCSWMLRSGAIEEVQGLLSQLSPHHDINHVLGLGDIVHYLNGKCTYSKLEESFLQKTLAYVKKQRTWFKKWKKYVSTSQENDVFQVRP